MTYKRAIGESRYVGPTTIALKEDALGQSDQEYLLARAEQEREIACRSSDEIVRAIHLRLAYEYSSRAHAGGTPPMANNEVLGLAQGGLRTF